MSVSSVTSTHYFSDEETSSEEFSYSVIPSSSSLISYGSFNSDGEDARLLNMYSFHHQELNENSLRVVDHTSERISIIFFRQFGDSLVNLSILRCDLNQNQMIEILKQCPNLKRLTTDIVVTDAILSEISNLSMLEELNLSICHGCTDDALIQCLPKLPYLRNLTLHECSNFSDDAFIQAVLPLKNLRTLELHNWTVLTNSSILKTTTELPVCEVFNLG